MGLPVAGAVLDPGDRDPRGEDELQLARIDVAQQTAQAGAHHRAPGVCVWSAQAGGGVERYLETQLFNDSDNGVAAEAPDTRTGTAPCSTLGPGLFFACCWGGKASR